MASDLQDQGLQAFLSIDRDTAGRLGITPAAIDTALYNAFGQRLVSTIFTQSNQYRVVLEVKPEFRLGPRSLGREIFRDKNAAERFLAHKALQGFDTEGEFADGERPLRREASLSSSG